MSYYCKNNLAVYKAF